MTNKEMYQVFSNNSYVPIFSQSWWLDVVCGSNNWDVWLYVSGGNILAAMPYYYTIKGKYKYITKAPLTQNNGIIFNSKHEVKLASREEFEQKVIDSACEWIKNANLDVYEQQYHYTFTNWQPFFWHNYECQVRYTFVIENTDNMLEVMNGYTAKIRSTIKKGQKNTEIVYNIEPHHFYFEHEKVFTKQGLKCPFSYELWDKLYEECLIRNCGMTLAAMDENKNVHSLAYLVWDTRSVYLLLGGSIPDFSSSDSYSYVIHTSIEFASRLHLKFDFEGSMIARVAKSIRQFGGEAKPYFRIRKVFNDDVLVQEFEIKRANNH